MLGATRCVCMIKEEDPLGEWNEGLPCVLFFDSLGFSRFHVFTLRKLGKHFVTLPCVDTPGPTAPNHARVDTQGHKLCPNIASIKQRTTKPPPPQPSIDPQRSLTYEKAVQVADRH